MNSIFEMRHFVFCDIGIYQGSLLGAMTVLPFYRVLKHLVGPLPKLRKRPSVLSRFHAVPNTGHPAPVVVGGASLQQKPAKSPVSTQRQR